MRLVLLLLVASFLLVAAGSRASGEVEVSFAPSTPPTQAPDRVVSAAPPQAIPIATTIPLSSSTAPKLPSQPPPPVPQPPLPLAPPPVPPSSGAAAVISRGNANRMTVALTFDAGSDAGYTAMILDTLAANGVRADFGMTGLWAERNPDLVRRMVNEGHMLINHSYDHASFTGRSSGKPALSQAQRREQLDRTEAILTSLTGASSLPYFRPPFGDYDASVNQDLAARGYMFDIMWTIDSRGWLGWTAPAIAQRCLEQAVPGAIYVFHVGSTSQDGPALQAIIDGLRAKGYTVGGVADVLAP